jgi:LmbE family N-acetylglucosaminyl deacetylase
MSRKKMRNTKTAKTSEKPVKHLLLAVLFFCLAAGAIIPAANRNTYPLPEDRGTAGILAAIEKLPVYVRVLQITAHPDDESAGSLVWLTRKAHARTALFSLTRGEGGQNILGNEKYEAMGLLRTGEFLEACKYYGVELYFSSAFDFGFSKSPEESIAKWGHDEILGEMVRFIRIWRPNIIISRFEGTPRDGHGHHQAAGSLAQEAYEAAGNPTRFPDQLKSPGLTVWKALKLYTSARGGDSAQAAGPVAAVPIGDYDPVLGRSYREIGSEGYSKHRSQGNGMGNSLAGRASDLFRLLSPAPAAPPAGTGLFAGMDISLLSILNLAGEERSAISFLEGDLQRVTKLAGEAIGSFRPNDPARSAQAIAEGIWVLRDAIGKLDNGGVLRPWRGDVVDALTEKLEDFENAANAVLGVTMIARTANPIATPGSELEIDATIYNRGNAPIRLKNAMLQGIRDVAGSVTTGTRISGLAPGESLNVKFGVKLSANPPLTQPYWYRDNPRENRYRFRQYSDPGSLLGAPYAPFDGPALTISAVYGFENADIPIWAPVQAQFGDPLRGSDYDNILIVPSLSVALRPEIVVVPVSPRAQDKEVQVTILSNEKSKLQTSVKLTVPAGWQVTPAELRVDLGGKGETHTAAFTVRIPAATPVGSFPVEAVASWNGREFRSGYQVVSYPENWTRNIYAPARASFEVFDVKVAPGLSVGYVPGAGDEVSAAIEQLGVKVQTLSAADLATADLSRLQTIVTGIRAYNVNSALRANNQRLLKYVENGGTLIVQYNQPLGRGDAAAFPYGPYPMTISATDRITVEDSPVTVLDPQSPVWNSPNRIAPADFEGWIQERGLYFMNRWDEHYKPLLSGHDPGEEAKAGGMLATRFGKGWYVYSANAWFRQLPAGVPGAYRIFANLLSLGR